METYLPFLLIFCVAFAVALVAHKLTRKHGGKYDERQIAAQGTAYKAAYFSLLLYMMLYGLVEIFIGTSWLSVWPALWGGIVLSVAVFAITCIVRDAYFRSVDSPTVSIILFLVLGAMDAYMGLRGVLWGGNDGGDWMIFFSGLLFIVVGLVALVKRSIDRKHADEES